MDSQKQIEQAVEAMVRYFELAEPDFEQNRSLIRGDAQQFGELLIPVGLLVTCAQLRELAGSQPLLGDEIELNDQLVLFAIMRTTQLVSVIDIFERGIEGLALVLAFSDEDLVALAAFMFTNPRFIRPANRQALEQAYSKAYGTSCKVALAAALYKHGVVKPFKEFAVPYLITEEGLENNRNWLRSVLPGEQAVESALLDELVVPGSSGHIPYFPGYEYTGVLRVVALDIASDGAAYLKPGGPWKRKGKDSPEA